VNAVLHLEPWQWAFGIAAAVVVGITKTGIPGAGILVVSLLAAAFGGRPSVGIMLPMLILGDLFAVTWYRKDVHWDKLVRLLPGVVAGMALGAAALWWIGELNSRRDILGILIGSLVLAMLVLHLLQDRLGERLTPTSRPGAAVTGVLAGFTTTVSNAAGSIMSIYMAAHRVTKKEFVGTLAWYFFIVNVSKVPIYVALTLANPRKPIITLQSLVFVAAVAPAIVTGVYLGKWTLNNISEKVFVWVVLTTAAVGAVKLILG